MRMSEIVRIDSRGRVTMPSSIRDAVRVSEGMYVILIADLDKKEVRIVPFADPEAKLVEFRITFADVPGALAKAADVLANRESICYLANPELCEEENLRNGLLSPMFLSVSVNWKNLSGKLLRRELQRK